MHFAKLYLIIRRIDSALRLTNTSRNPKTKHVEMPTPMRLVMLAAFSLLGIGGLAPAQTPDFSLIPESSLTPFVGGSGAAQIAVNSLSGFSAAVNLSVSGVPPGGTVSFSLNPVSPPAAGTSYTTLTLSLSPAVAATTFPLTVTGLSGILSHSVEVSVTISADAASITNAINQIAAAGCIQHPVFSDLLIADLAAAQVALEIGDVKAAANTLSALSTLITSQAGKNISTSCTISGTPFNPATVLSTDVAAFAATLNINPDPVVGYVLTVPQGSGLKIPQAVPGATVTVSDSSGKTVASALTDVSGFYFFATTGILQTRSTYTAAVTGLPPGYGSSSVQKFTWNGRPEMLAPLLLTPATFTITRTANPPDAITGHAYAAYIATSLASGSATSDMVSACSLSGSVPAGMTAAPGSLPGSGGSPYYCVLAMAAAPAAGQYTFTLQARDNSSPQQTNSFAYTMTVHPDFAFTTTALAPGVQGRTYGMAPLSQPEPTNIGGTQGGLAIGNAPLTACSLLSVTPANPGLTVALDSTRTRCLLSSAALTAAGTFSVTVSATETQITDSVTGIVAVPASSTTPVSSTLPLVSNLSLALTVNEGSIWPDGVTGRTYGSGTGCISGPCTPVIYTATGGLGGYTFPATTSATLPAGFLCPAVSASATYSCSAAAPGITAAAGIYHPSATVNDVANSATPAATAASDPLSTRTDTLTINAEMKITAPTPSTAVSGRAYGTGTGCSGGSCAPLDYKVSFGLGNYTVAGSSLTTPFDTFTCALNSPDYLCSKVAIAASGGASPTLTFVAAETGNVSTPGHSVTDTTQTLKVNPEMNFTAAPSSLANAVIGRSYGVGSTCGTGTSLCTAPSYTTQSGTGLGGYSFAFAVGSGNGGFACTGGGTTSTCSSSSVTGAPGTYNAVHATVTDVANGSTPSNTISSSNAALTVFPEMLVTPPATVAVAVTGRSYGVGGSGCSGGPCAPLTYKVSGGLGNYTSTGSSLKTASDTFNCYLISGGFSCADTSITGSSDAGLAFTAAETGNASTPGNAVPENTKILPVHREMSVTPPQTVPPAVKGRAYGTGSGCAGPGGACQPLQYSVSGGLGNYSATGASLTPAGDNFTCTVASGTYSCSSSVINDTAGTNPTLTFVAAETGNASTPGNTTTPDTSKALVVQSEMTVTPPVLPSTAVHGRRYGTGTGCSGVFCQPLQYSLSGGLGNYTLTGTSLIAGADTFTCTIVSPTFSCSTSAISGPGGSISTLTFIAAETGNASTPGNTTTPDTSKSLFVQSEMTVTALTVAPSIAVHGRPYGTGTGCSGVNCQPLQYSLSGGLENYTLTGSSLIAGADTFTCTIASPTFSCYTSAISGPGGSSPTLEFTGAETGNASTPGNTTEDRSLSLTVNAALALATPPAFPEFPDGENNVTYGSASAGCAPGNVACTPLTYSVPFVYPIVEGLPPYVFTRSGFPGSLNCMQSSAGSPAPDGTILTCSATSGINASGPFPESFTPTVQVADTPNVSVPGGTVSSGPASLTIQPRLSILDTVLPNGLVGFAYNPSGSGVTIKSQGGIGPTTWVGPGDSASGACAAPSAATLPGITAMTFNDVTQVFSTGGASFAAADVSVVDGAYRFQVCVTDTGNAATPQTAALPNPNPPTGSHLQTDSFVFDVLNTFAYVTETSAEAVDIINTSTNEVVGTGIDLGVAPTAHPNGVAISSDGTRAWVTLSDNKLAYIDTITNTQIYGSPYAMPPGSTCTSLAGVAMTNDGRAYIACPTGTGGGVVDVISTDNGTLVAELATGDMPTGVAVSPTVDPITGKTKQVYVTLNTANQLVVITNAAIPTMGIPIDLTATNGGPLSVAAVTNPTGDVYVYITKNSAGTGNPGVDIVDANTLTLTGAIHFATSTQVPVGVAVTPDATQVYVSLTDTAGPAGEVWVIENQNPPASRMGSPFSLPAPNAAAMNTGPVGVAIPPLSTVPAPAGYPVYIAQSAASNIDVLNDNPYSSLLALGTGDGVTTTFHGSFPTVPLATASVEVVATARAATVTGFDSGSGIITGTGIAAGTVNYSTGAVSVTFSIAPDNGSSIEAFIIPTNATAKAARVNLGPHGIATVPLPAKPPGLQ